MHRQIACGLFAVGLLSSASAQPFGWFPGSTVNPNSETADRVVIVNLADGTVESDIPGNPHAPAWRYTEDFAGKDSFIPTFSPNGEFVYLINGGKGDAPVNEPDGHIRLYNAVDVIAAFRAGTTPEADSWIQEFVIPAAGSDAVEPLCFTIDAAEPNIGSRGYFIDASYEQLYTLDIQPDSTLMQVNVVNSGERPSPIWLHPTQPFGFFCSFVQDVPQVHVVDTSDGPTAGTILKSIDLALAPPNGGLNFEYASCTLPMSSLEVQSNTLVPPSWPAINQVPANELWIYAGGIGVQANLFGSPQRVSDAFNIYKLDIQSADPELMELTNGGNPEFTVAPSGYVAFPPFIQANDNGNGVYALAGGSTVIHPDGTTRDTLLQPSGSSNDNWFPIIGEMLADRNEIYLGSASEANALDFINNREYVASHQNSKIYKYEFDPIMKSAKENVTLIEVADIQRSVSFVVGRTDTRVVIGASDTFMVDLTDDIGFPANVDDSQCVLLDPADPTPQDSLIVVDLELIAGAYGQQPEIQIPEPGEPDFAIVDSSDSDPVTAGETIVLPTVTAGTASSRTFQVTNNGTATLSLDVAPPINGFTVGEGLASLLAPAASDTFTIDAPTGPAGFYSTSVFIGTNDPDTPSLSFTLQITIDPATGNEAPTDIELSGPASVNEAAPGGTVIGTLSTTDPNVGDTHTYSVVDESNGKAFATFAVDGDLVVTDPSLLDVTVTTTKNVTIRTTDQGGLFHEETFAITVTPNVLVSEDGDEPVRFLGDSNGDGNVNTQDFLASRNNFFDDYMCLDYRGVGDANGDGSVNTQDFLTSRNNFFNDYTDLTYEQALEQDPCAK